MRNAFSATRFALVHCLFFTAATQLYFNAAQSIHLGLAATAKASPIPDRLNSSPRPGVPNIGNRPHEKQTVERTQWGADTGARN